MFKKTMALALAALLLLALASCARGAAADPGQLTRLGSSGFRFSADYTVGGFSGSFSYSRIGNGQSALRYTGPETIADMSIEQNGDICTVEYGGIRHEVPYAELPNSHPLKALCALFDSITAGLNMPGELPYTSRTNAKGETVFTDSGNNNIAFYDGTLCFIEMPALGLEFTISDFQYLEPETQQPAGSPDIAETLGGDPLLLSE